MPDAWPTVTVEAIKAPVDNALATGPFGSSIGSRFFRDAGVPVIRGSNLSDAVGVRLNHEGLVFLDPDKARQFSRSVVKRGDLVFTCWGTIGQVGLIDERCPYEEYVVSNKQMKLTPDPRRADSLFLYYLFSGPEMSGRIRNQAIGSSVPGFNLTQLRSLELHLPPLHEQKAIASILGSLDDKIELNRRMNETLEAMARAIFKSWFVDFDPVRTKMEGRKPVGMDADTAALFPDSFQDSPLGKIPKGWQVRCLGDLLDLAYGKPMKEEDRQGGDVPVYGSNGRVGWHNERLVAGPGIIVGRKGNPGIVKWSQTDFFPIDTTFYVVPKTQGALYFLYEALCLQDLPSLNADSAVPGLNRNIAYMNTVVVPPPSVLSAFERLGTVMRAKYHSAEQESQTLSAIRDALLPKLLSGELRPKAL